jgi:hypothetical protein
VSANPIWQKDLSCGDAIEIEVVGGGLSVCNYNSDKDDTFISILSVRESLELRDFLTANIKPLYDSGEDSA